LKQPPARLFIHAYSFSLLIALRQYSSSSGQGYLTLMNETLAGFLTHYVNDICMNAAWRPTYRTWRMSPIKFDRNIH
jgi:hypothetical protein